MAPWVTCLWPLVLEIRRSACLYSVLPVTEARLTLPQALSDQSWGNTIVTWNIEIRVHCTMGNKGD